ncbi:GDSL-type esterase/lipase family protein [Sphingomonas sp. DT-204]|uniref:GDSL-type esterase/lipase family protein n=1 Tax=Sphingomonas sp. DT-204 TaxID=3396166 RepID=UPI003F1CFA38
MLGGLALPFAANGACGQTAPAREESWDERWQRLLREDFGHLFRYRDDNAALLASGRPVDIVFMGDSITEGWRDKRPGFFIPGRIGRGIGGQTTPQMLVRFQPDVIDLKPRAVHIMAGTNDIAGNTGPMTEEAMRDNFRAMTTLARANGIHVILASIPPAAAFPWRPGLDVKAPIASLNRWLKSYAARIGATWVDYHPALADASGAMKPGLASDGVHPTEAGYAAMETVLTPVLRGGGG